jgi:hypothetical protein
MGEWEYRSWRRQNQSRSWDAKNVARWQDSFVNERNLGFAGRSNANDCFEMRTVHIRWFCGQSLICFFVPITQCLTVSGFYAIPFARFHACVTAVAEWNKGVQRRCLRLALRTVRVVLVRLCSSLLNPLVVRHTQEFSASENKDMENLMSLNVELLENWICYKSPSHPELEMIMRHSGEMFVSGNYKHHIAEVVHTYKRRVMTNFLSSIVTRFAQESKLSTFDNRSSLLSTWYARTWSDNVHLLSMPIRDIRLRKTPKFCSWGTRWRLFRLTYRISIVRISDHLE